MTPLHRVRSDRSDEPAICRLDGYASLGIFDDQAVCLLPTFLYAKEESSNSQRQCCAGSRSFGMKLYAGVPALLPIEILYTTHV
eukprot:SAG31_NODE_3217_length_4537_cov_1.607481_3_plen_84_part_00